MGKQSNHHDRECDCRDCQIEKTPSRPEPMTAEEKAREIANPHYDSLDEDDFELLVDAIAAALHEARAEALKGFPNVREFDYAQGFSDCRGKVMEILEPTELDDKSYERIRALTPSEGKES